jgi:hypothetical protein
MNFSHPSPRERGRGSERESCIAGRFSLCIFFACFVAAQGRTRLGAALLCLAYLQNGALYLACAAYTLLLAPEPLRHLPAEAAAAAKVADRHEAFLHIGYVLS